MVQETRGMAAERIDIERHADPSADFAQEHDTVEGLLDLLSLHGSGTVNYHAEVRIDSLGNKGPAPELVVKTRIGLEAHRGAQVKPASPGTPVAEADSLVGMKPAEQCLRQLLYGGVLPRAGLHVRIIPGRC